MADAAEGFRPTRQHQTSAEDVFKSLSWFRYCHGLTLANTKREIKMFHGWCFPTVTGIQRELGVTHSLRTEAFSTVRSLLQRHIPTENHQAYSAMLRCVCTSDLQACSGGGGSGGGGCAQGEGGDSYTPCGPYDVSDPYGPIKHSMERTIMLIRTQETTFASFLVETNKKVILQAQRHPRASIILRQYAEIVYEVSTDSILFSSESRIKVKGWRPLTYSNQP